VGWHGHSAEGNPSGGNKFRGLYNIALKSIGAARKKDPEVQLDYVIDYSERMTAPGFYFMDSPGNDLESIAGQVASGCNMIFFTTGNGSITNFPFVPTVKFVTTTGRWNLLHDDMDVNATDARMARPWTNWAGNFHLHGGCRLRHPSVGGVPGIPSVHLARLATDTSQ
jgi:altronate dehydratase